MPVRKNIANQVFGKLTALREGPPVRRTGGGICKSTWVCRCECGTSSFVAQSALLINGHQRSCGCVSHTTSVVGQKFGMLTVLREATATHRHGQGHVVCVCDCDPAREIILQALHLRSGNNKSCGCGRKGRILGPVARYEFRGEQRTVAEIAAALGISGVAVRSRIEKGRELDSPRVRRGRVLERFKTGVEHKNTKTYLIRGRTMTRKEIVEASGLTESALRNRMQKHGLSLGQSAMWPGKREQRWTLFGEAMTLSELTVVSGRSRDKVKKALSAGLTPEVAAFGDCKGESK